MRVIASLILLLFIRSVTLVHAETSRAQLRIIVRDGAGAPLAGVHVSLSLDGDDGRSAIGQQATDAAGQVVYTDLAYGIYVVAFAGVLPDGRQIIPVAQQNLGLLDDGAGAPGGFGVRVVQPDVQQLFVLGTLAGEARAVPMFDLAPALDVPPTPIDPLLELAKPTPTTFALAPAQAPAAQAPAQERWLFLPCLVALSMLCGLAVLGCWQSLRARRQAEQLAGGQHDEEA